MKYPYRLRIKDPELNKILTRLAHDRTVTINGDKSALKKLSYKISPIRKDIFIGWDNRTYESNISLKNPMLKLEMEKIKSNCKKYTFKY